MKSHSTDLSIYVKSSYSDSVSAAALEVLTVVCICMCSRFNLIGFSRMCTSWKSGLVDSTEDNCHDAAQWISALVADGNTCTLQALQVPLYHAFLHSTLKDDLSTNHSQLFHGQPTRLPWYCFMTLSSELVFPLHIRSISD